MGEKVKLFDLKKNKKTCGSKMQKWIQTDTNSVTLYLEKEKKEQSFVYYFYVKSSKLVQSNFLLYNIWYNLFNIWYYYT